MFCNLLCCGKSRVLQKKLEPFLTSVAHHSEYEGFCSNGKRSMEVQGKQKKSEKYKECWACCNTSKFWKCDLMIIQRKQYHINIWLRSPLQASKGVKDRGGRCLFFLTMRCFPILKDVMFWTMFINFQQCDVLTMFQKIAKHRTVWYMMVLGQ